MLFKWNTVPNVTKCNYDTFISKLCVVTGWGRSGGVIRNVSVERKGRKGWVLREYSWLGIVACAGRKDISLCYDRSSYKHLVVPLLMKVLSQ